MAIITNILSKKDYLITELIKTVREHERYFCSERYILELIDKNPGKM